MPLYHAHTPKAIYLAASRALRRRPTVTAPFVVTVFFARLRRVLDVFLALLFLLGDTPPLVAVTRFMFVSIRR